MLHECPNNQCGSYGKPSADGCYTCGCNDTISQHVAPKADVQLSNLLNFLKQLLCCDPTNNDEMKMVAEPKDNEDGSYTITMQGKNTGNKWQHTIKTTEI